MTNKPKEIREDHVHLFSQYKELDIAPETFLLEPWLISPSYNLIVAARGLGKSWFSLSVAIAIASGTNVMGWNAPEAKKVLYIDGEMSPRQLQDRLNMMTVGMEHIDENLLIMSVPYMVRCGYEPPMFAQHDWRVQLMVYLASHMDISCIIFDNVSCLFGGIDENDKMAWDEPDAWLVQLRSLGITSIVVHHTGKESSKGQRGSSSREDHVDVSLRLKGVAGWNPSDGCKLVTHFSKARSVHGDAIKPIQMDLRDVDGRLQFVEGEATMLQEDIIAMVESGMSFRATSQELGCSTRYVTTVIKKHKETIGDV